MDHPAYYEKIRTAATPLEAKRLGGNRKLSIPPDWDRIRYGVMERGVRAKFDAHPDLKALLLGTGEARLVEANVHDEYWGIGSGKGANRLGRLLMKLRETYRQEGAKVGMSTSISK